MTDDHTPPRFADVTIFPTRVRLPNPMRRRAAEARQAQPPKCHCGRPVPASSTCGCCAECECDLSAAKRRHPSGKEKQ